MAYSVIFRTFLLPVMVVLVLAMAGCESKDTPKSVSDEFWTAIQNNDMESAKQWVSWESVDYLKYFSDGKIRLKRYTVGESTEHSGSYHVATEVVVDTKNQADIRIPTDTVVIKKGDSYKIDLKATLAQVLSKTLNAAANQFNKIFQQGLQELDQALTDSLDDLGQSMNQITDQVGKSLNQGINELNRSMDKLEQDLNKSLPPKRQPPKVPEQPKEQLI